MFEAIILGVVQGLTEFLPVSSSGHIVIVPYLLPGIEPPPLAFGVAVHAGSLIAVLTYFWSELVLLATAAVGRASRSGRAVTATQARSTVLTLAIASLPAATIGLLLKATFEELFDRPQFVAVFLIVTALLLWAAESIRRRRNDKATGAVPTATTPQSATADPGRDEHSVTVPDAVVIGFAQAFAILPGVSRAGATMAAGMARGMSRQGAARFSFLLSIPVILGAFVFSLPDLGGGAMESTGYGGSALVAGMVAAGLSGYGAIRFLLRLVTTKDLLGFARYVAILGGFTLIAYYGWLGPPAVG